MNENKTWSEENSVEFLQHLTATFKNLSARQQEKLLKVVGEQIKKNEDDEIKEFLANIYVWAETVKNSEVRDDTN